MNSNYYAYKLNNNKINKGTNNKLGISAINNGKSNNFVLSKRTKDKEKEKRDISAGKMNNIGKKINNFFDDIEELDEDNMQKLELKPTPINEPLRKKTLVPAKKKNKFALQKKTKTDRAENVKTSSNNSNTLKNKLNNDKEKEKLTEELLKNKIFEEDFTEPKEEKMLINKQNEEKKHKFEMKSKSLANGEINVKLNEEQNLENEKQENKKEPEPEPEQINKNEDQEKIEEQEPEQEQSSKVLIMSEENIPYIVEEQEALIANHMEIIKSEAKLLTEEGNLISKIKGITEENYTMEEYVYKIEDIIKTKLKYFQELKQKIKEYKSLLG